jgi:hypothetical protein
MAVLAFIYSSLTSSKKGVSQANGCCYKLYAYPSSKRKKKRDKKRYREKCNERLVKNKKGDDKKNGKVKVKNELGVR